VLERGRVPVCFLPGITAEVLHILFKFFFMPILTNLSFIVVNTRISSSGCLDSRGFNSPTASSEEYQSKIASTLQKHFSLLIAAFTATFGLRTAVDI